MLFSEMIEILKDQIIDTSNVPDFIPNKLCYDSRTVEAGDIFFAVKGYKTDGNLFIDEVFLKGAGSVITDSGNGVSDARILRVKDARKSMALMSSKFYGFPSSKMKMIAVTGTNGKTTTSMMIYHILNSCGKRCGLIGTNGNMINNRLIKTSFTTPESVDLQKLLREMADEKAEFVSMEISSHALALDRVYGIDFDIAVFTNLTVDHLDFHGSMENYLTTKKILFDSLKRINSKKNKTSAIYNCDDSAGNSIVSSTEAERISYGLKNGMYKCSNFDMSISGTSFKLLVPHNGSDMTEIKIKTNLPGRFNIYNTIAAISACYSAGIGYEEIAKAVKTFQPVEGRFNRVPLKKGATAIIDYSHTPDSLQNAISTIREILNNIGSKGKIITVFGCGGNRDKTKRPLMGDIATRLSDLAVITSDNPRDENPSEIIDEIKQGIRKDNYMVIENREEAIRKAIELSGKKDVVLVAGKGHETYQEIKGIKHSFSDKDIIEKYS